MALTSSQRVNLRRWAGYGVGGDAEAQFFSAPLYASSTGQGQITSLTLDFRLDHLTSSEEQVLLDVYLDKLETLETDILKVGDSIDTSEAGPWKANPREQSDREKLFNSWRRQMCDFIGLQPGPGLGSGGLAIVRS